VLETPHVMQWPQRAVFRIVPTDQRFDAPALAFAEADHRLVLQTKRFCRDKAIELNESGLIRIT
jgi:hypothetical protein